MYAWGEKDGWCGDGVVVVVMMGLAVMVMMMTMVVVVVVVEWRMRSDVTGCCRCFVC